MMMASKGFAQNSVNCLLPVTVDRTNSDYDQWLYQTGGFWIPLLLFTSLLKKPRTDGPGIYPIFG